MKFIVAVSAFVAAVAAQDISSLPPCGQMCINNMVQIANTQFGCANGDVKCYCSNAQFANGLKDCSAQACGADVSAQVVAFGTAYCQSAGVTPGGSGGSSASAGAGASGATTTTGAAASGASAASSASSSGASVLSSAKSSASAAVSSISSSLASGASSAASKASSAAGASGSGGAGGSGGSASGSSSSGFAMKTHAPLAGAGALGLAALLLV